MFGIGFWELIIIGLVLFLVIVPAIVVLVVALTASTRRKP